MLEIQIAQPQGAELHAAQARIQQQVQNRPVACRQALLHKGGLAALRWLTGLLEAANLVILEDAEERFLGFGEFDGGGGVGWQVAAFMQPAKEGTHVAAVGLDGPARPGAIAPGLMTEIDEPLL